MPSRWGCHQIDDKENAHANNDASEKAIFFKMLTSIPTDRKRNTRAQTVKYTKKQPAKEKTAIEAEANTNTTKHKVYKDNTKNNDKDKNKNATKSKDNDDKDRDGHETENDDENKANNKDSNRDHIYIPATPTKNTDKQGLKKLASMENATARPQNPSEPEKSQRKTSKKTHDMIRTPIKTHGDDEKGASPKHKKRRIKEPNMHKRPPDDAVR